MHPVAALSRTIGLSRRGSRAGSGAGLSTACVALALLIASANAAPAVAPALPMAPPRAMPMPEQIWIDLLRSHAAAVEQMVARTKPQDWKMRHACLYYAFAAQTLLARDGIATSLRVGAVIYRPGTATAHGISPHAWLETPGYFIDYSTLPRWGEVSLIPRQRVAAAPAEVEPGVTAVLTRLRPADADLRRYLAAHRMRFQSMLGRAR